MNQSRITYLGLINGLIVVVTTITAQEIHEHLIRSEVRGERDLGGTVNSVGIESTKALLNLPYSSSLLVDGLMDLAVTIPSIRKIIADGAIDELVGFVERHDDGYGVGVYASDAKTTRSIGFADFYDSMGGAPIN